jgi:hypothetical protein
MKNQVEEIMDASEWFGEPDEIPKADEEMEAHDRLSIKIIPGHDKAGLTLRSYWELSDETNIASILLFPDELRAVASKLIELAATIEGGDFEKQEIMLAEHRENC